MKVSNGNAWKKNSFTANLTINMTTHVINYSLGADNELFCQAQK